MEVKRLFDIAIDCFTNYFFCDSLDVLVEAVHFSVDPYMRPYMERYDVGVTMIGGQIAK